MPAVPLHYLSGLTAPFARPTGTVVAGVFNRTMACYYDERLSGKVFYFIVTAAEDKPALERTMDGLRGLTDCIPDAKVCGCIYGANAWQLGDIQGNPAMDEAYQMGKAI